MKPVILNSSFIPEDYKLVVDSSILNISFKPDIFQQQGFYYLEKNESILVCAHTSSGKTLIAEYAILKALNNNRKIIYTSPIKALSNQKYYEFKNKYKDVGIITGDVKINENGSCLIMTTEILRNYLYKNNPILEKIDYVIFDEVHYINEKQRGVVWEECIILLNERIKLLMLSATISNIKDFAYWVSKTRNSPVHVIQTSKRAVPLDIKILRNDCVYSQEGKLVKEIIYKDMRMIDKLHIKKGDPKENKKIVFQQQEPKKLNIYAAGKYLKEYNMLPAIFFCFSKKSCHVYAKTLKTLNFLNKQEIKRVEDFCLESLCNSNVELNFPQVEEIVEYLKQGVGIHHSSLLPILKEITEMLFSKNLIKILVATETFAMGVNMPAKTVLFTDLYKFTDKTVRLLNQSEFIQMAGRAGRRGLDDKGFVFVASKRIPRAMEFKKLISGTPCVIDSKFRLSFNMILSLMRGNFEIKEVMMNSFGESQFKDECFQLLEDNNKVNNLLQLINTEKIGKEEIKQYEKMFIACKVSKLINLRKGNTNELTDKLDNLNLTENNNLTIEKLNYVVDYVFDQENEIAPFNLKIQYKTKSDDVLNLDLQVLLKELQETLTKDINYELLMFVALTDKKKNYNSLIEKNNLIFAKNLQNRQKFLLDENFIDTQNNLKLKGEIAAEIKTIEGVIFTTMLFDNIFEKFDAAQIFALASCFLPNHEGLSSGCLEPSEKLKIEEVISAYEAYREFYVDVLEKYDISGVDLDFSSSTSCPVYLWCIGKSFGEIITKTKITEGNLVKILLRLVEFYNEIQNILPLLKNEEFEEKFFEFEKMLKRDIIYVQSLYLNDNVVV